MTPPTLRLVAAAFWTGALTLLVTGSFLDYGDRLPYFAWSLWLCFPACVATGWLIMEHLIARRDERNVQRIAAAVGVAIGQHLATRDAPRPISRIR